MSISFYKPAQIIELMQAERQEVEAELLEAYRYLQNQREGTQSYNIGKGRVNTLEQILKASTEATKARPSNAGSPISLGAVQRTLLVSHNELVDYLERYMGRLGEIEEEELAEGIQNLQQSVQRVCNLVDPEAGNDLVARIPGAVAKRLYIQTEEPDPQGTVDFSKFAERERDGHQQDTVSPITRIQAQAADTYELFFKAFNDGRDPTGVSIDIETDTAQLLMDTLMDTINDICNIVNAETGQNYRQAHPGKALNYWEADTD